MVVTLQGHSGVPTALQVHAAELQHTLSRLYSKAPSGAITKGIAWTRGWGGGLCWNAAILLTDSSDCHIYLSVGATIDSHA